MCWEYPLTGGFLARWTCIKHINITVSHVVEMGVVPTQNTFF